MGCTKGVLPIICGLYGEASPERGTFFMLQQYEMVEISLVEVFEREGKKSLSFRSVKGLNKRAKSPGHKGEPGMRGKGIVKERCFEAWPPES